jgi:hypothetical protein
MRCHKRRWLSTVMMMLLVATATTATARKQLQVPHEWRADVVADCDPSDGHQQGADVVVGEERNLSGELASMLLGNGEHITAYVQKELNPLLQAVYQQIREDRGDACDVGDLEMVRDLESSGNNDE